MILNETTLNTFLIRFAERRVEDIKKATSSTVGHRRTYIHGDGELHQQCFFGVKFRLDERNRDDIGLDFLVDFDADHMKKHLKKESPWREVYQKWNVKSSMSVVPFELEEDPTLPQALIYGQRVSELAIVGMQLEARIKSKLAQDIRSELLCRCPLHTVPRRI